MTAPNSTRTTTVVPSLSRRRRGTIASRYLEAIHCGGGTSTILQIGTNSPNDDGVSIVNNSARNRSRNNKNSNNNNNNNSNSSVSNSSVNNSSRTQRTTNTHQTQHSQTTTQQQRTAHQTAVTTIAAAAAAFRSTPISRSSRKSLSSSNTTTTNNNMSNLMSLSANVAKVADCSRSIVTASTTILDTSDSISTSHSPSGEQRGRHQTRRQEQRRGRSRTPNKFGTNSTSSRNGDTTTTTTNNNNADTGNGNDNGNGESSYYHAPGSRSTVPLSGGADDVNDNDDSSDSSDSSTSSIESSDSTRYLSIDMGNKDNDNDNDNDNDIDNWDSSNNNSSQGRGRGILMFPKTNPRHAESPGPQPKSPGKNNNEKRSSSNKYSQLLTNHQQEQQYNQDEPIITPFDEVTLEEGDAEQSFSEAGAPTEIITNSTSQQRPYSFSSDSIVTSANTEVMTNRTTDILSRVIQQQKDGENRVAERVKELQRGMMITSSNSNSNSSKTEQGRSQSQSQSQSQSKYGGTSYLKGPPAVLRKGWTPYSNKYLTSKNDDGEEEEVIPSLFDTQSQSSSVSSSDDLRINLPSILTTASTTANGGINNNNNNNINKRCVSRLSRHVQNARQRSILSPSASETTASITGDMPSVSSLKPEIGGSSLIKQQQGPSSRFRKVLYGVENKTEQQETEDKEEEGREQNNNEINKRCDDKATIKQSATKMSMSTSTSTAAKESLRTPRVWQKTKLGGLRRQAVAAPGNAARVVALAAHYRKGKFTVRGAQQQLQQQQEEQKERSEIHDDNDDGEEEEDHRSEAGTSNATNQVESPVAPDPIINVAADKEEEYDNDDDHDDDESTIPEYIEDHSSIQDRSGRVKDRAEDFVIYNQRPKQNASEVFQSKKGPPSREEEETESSKHGDKTRRLDRNSSSRSDERGKSPIQLLFSLDRLDECNDSSIHESSIRSTSIRSRSLGRSMTSEQFMRLTNSDHKRTTTNLFENEDGDGDGNHQEPNKRRSKSLSQRSERKLSYKSTGLSDAVRAIARDRRSRLTTNAVAAVISSSHQQEKQQPISHRMVPVNIVIKKETRANEDEGDNVLEEELVHIMEKRHEEKEPWNHGQQVRPYSAPSYQLSRSQTPSSRSERSVTQSSIRSNLRYDHAYDDGMAPQKQPMPSSSRQATVKESETDIKGDTESFNKMSPKESISIKDKIRAFNLKKSPRSVSEFDYNQGRKPLTTSARDRKSMLEGNTEEEEKKDDAGIGNYLDTIEREYLKTYYVGANDDSIETNNDDYSVQSLREQLEQRINGNGHHGFDGDDDEDDDRSVKSLREMFEPPVNKQNGEIVSNLKARFEPKISRVARLSFTGTKNNLGPFEAREEIQGDSLESNWDREEKEHAIIGKTKPEKSFRPPLQKETETERRENVTINAAKGKTSKNATTPVNNRSSQWTKRRQIENSTGNHSNPSYDMAPATEESTPEIRREIFRLDNNGRTSSEDHDQKIPGSHWTSQGVCYEHEKVSHNNYAPKGLSTDFSEYSDAVTLDASICEVSYLSNPSAIRSKDSRDSRDTDRCSDASSSVLFENFANKAYTPISPLNTSRSIHAKSPNSIFDEQGNAEVRNNTFVSSPANASKSNEGYISPITPTISISQRQATPDLSPSQGVVNYKRLLSHFHGLESSTRSSRSMDHPHQALESSSRSSRSLNNPNRATTDISTRSDISTDNPHRVIESSTRSTRSMDNRHDFLGSTSSSRSSRSIDNPHRILDSSNRSSRSLDAPRWRRSQLSNFEDESPPSLNQSPNPSDFQFQKDYGPSREDIRNRNLPKPVVRPSPPVTKQPAVPAMPSPFNPDYAAIMESRHKMLLSRQRALVHRRANREKIQSSQTGFFGRTYPEKIETKRQASTGIHQNFNSISKGTAYISLQDKESSTPIRNNKSYPLRGSETTPKRLSIPSKEPERIPYTSLVESEYPKQNPYNLNVRSPKKTPGKNEKQNPSIVSKIRTTFGMSTNKPKRTAQNQAVIDRISAVRAARLRRHHTYGDRDFENISSYRQRGINNDNSNNGQASKLNTINDLTSGYTYYTHNDTNEPHNYRDEDQSLSTNESNAQEYAANLAVD
jgi:hypothetical protein